MGDTFTREQVQRLIDLTYEVAIRMQMGQKFESPESAAEWVRRQLRNLGFPTVAVGMSWGALDLDRERRASE